METLPDSFLEIKSSYSLHVFQSGINNGEPLPDAHPLWDVKTPKNEVNEDLPEFFVVPIRIPEKVRGPNLFSKIRTDIARELQKLDYPGLFDYGLEHQLPLPVKWILIDLQRDAY